MNKYQIILLVGGKSTRFNEYNNEENAKPKSLGIIDKETLLAHVIKNFTKYKFNEFILPLGHHKESFIKYFIKTKFIGNIKCNATSNLSKYKKFCKIKKNEINIFLFHTGRNTSKAERINKVIKKMLLKNLVVSYGDAVGNVNLNKVLKIHESSDCLVTGVGMIMKSQYGHYSLNKKNIATEIKEKPLMKNLVNIGYFFFKEESLKYFNKYKKNDLEEGIINKLVKDKKVKIYEHKKFWKSVDTMKDLLELKKYLKSK